MPDPLTPEGLSRPKRWCLGLVALVPLSFLLLIAADSGGFDPEDFATELLRSLAQALREWGQVEFGRPCVIGARRRQGRAGRAYYGCQSAA